MSDVATSACPFRASCRMLFPDPVLVAPGLHIWHLTCRVSFPALTRPCGVLTVCYGHSGRQGVGAVFKSRTHCVKDLALPLSCRGSANSQRGSCICHSEADEAGQKVARWDNNANPTCRSLTRANGESIQGCQFSNCNMRVGPGAESVTKPINPGRKCESTHRIPRA